MIESKNTERICQRIIINGCNVTVRIAEECSGIIYSNPASLPVMALLTAAYDERIGHKLTGGYNSVRVRKESANLDNRTYFCKTSPNYEKTPLGE